MGLEVEFYGIWPPRALCLFFSFLNIGISARQIGSDRCGILDADLI